MEFVSWDYDIPNMAVCQNLVPLVTIKIAGKWMFIPLKMVLIGIDPYPYGTIKFMFQTTNQIGLEPQLLLVDHSSPAAELLIIWLLPASARHHNAWHAGIPVARDTQPNLDQSVGSKRVACVYVHILSIYIYIYIKICVCVCVCVCVLSIYFNFNIYIYMYIQLYSVHIEIH